MIEIRRMKPEDIEAVHAIECVAFPTPWSREALEGELKNSLAVYYVLIEDGLIAAYGGMWTIVDELHVTNVAVAPAYRRKGYGDQLMHTLIVYGRDHGFAHMTLEVRVGNHPAIALYEKYGFIAVGTRPGYYVDTGEDACIMWKEL